MDPVNKAYVPPHLRIIEPQNKKQEIKSVQNSSLNEDKKIKPWSKKTFHEVIDIEVLPDEKEIEIQKRVSGTIKKIKNHADLILFCENPKLGAEPVHLNAIHYTLVYNKILDFLRGRKKTRKIKLTESHKNWGDINQITDVMIDRLKYCPIGFSTL